MGPFFASGVHLPTIYEINQSAGVVNLSWDVRGYQLETSRYRARGPNKPKTWAREMTSFRESY